MNLILSILVNGLWRDDNIYWALDKWGVFSVKSAYRLGLNLVSFREGSPSFVEMTMAL